MPREMVIPAGALNAEHAFTAFFGGAVQELVPADGDITAFRGKAYRARLDRDFTRFEHAQGDRNTYWVAFTTDGRSFFFGDRPGTWLGEDWRLSRIRDRWGNEILYHYESVVRDGHNVDLQLVSIEYSHHVTEEIAAHARVRLLYDLGAPACTCEPAGPMLSRLARRWIMNRLSPHHRDQSLEDHNDRGAGDAKVSLATGPPVGIGL